MPVSILQHRLLRASASISRDHGGLAEVGAGAPLSTGVEDLHALASRNSMVKAAKLTLGATTLDRFVFEGPASGGERIRIGVFAGIHGDEPAGVTAAKRLIYLLAAHPEIGTGYQISVYPVCNPTGIALRTRLSLTGKDLNREFWRGSTEPEVQLLETEIRKGRFNGLISLHSDDTSDGVYGFVRGAVLGKGLLEPALNAAERFLARNINAVIDGFPAERGIITDCYQGILTAPPTVCLEQQPFEIILETPAAAAEELQVQAFLAALETIFREYQDLLSFAANL
ncbi:MAG TPA: succinylglutamate desuccinylase/aspartoacylase family protein [Methylomirabilota bacterium]|nr:succinylglutamate desuccinylase/aspartoacylase family protein [Methylomirabilota bacterium]